MLKLKNKKEVLGYIKNKFRKQGKLILIRGSIINKPVKNYSDFDIEVYGNTLKKPYYEIIFIKEKLILISVYFYKYKRGKKAKTPKNIKVLYGKYNNKIKPNFKKDEYNKEKVKRECQMVVDFFFKYLRSKNKKYLDSVQKRIK
jgi:hypothetical protein